MTTATMTDYSKISWSELRGVAAEREVPTGRKKRSWVEKQLRNQDGFRTERSKKAVEKIRLKGPRTPKREVTTVRVAGGAGASEPGYTHAFYTDNCRNIFDSDMNIIAKVFKHGNVMSERKTLLDIMGHCEVIVDALNEAAS